MSKFKAFFRPSTLKTDIFFHTNFRVGYVYIENSFDITFNTGSFGRGRYGSNNRPCMRVLRTFLFDYVIDHTHF